MDYKKALHSYEMWRYNPTMAIQHKKLKNKKPWRDWMYRNLGKNISISKFGKRFTHLMPQTQDMWITSIPTEISDKMILHFKHYTQNVFDKCKIYWSYSFKTRWNEVISRWCISTITTIHHYKCQHKQTELQSLLKSFSFCRVRLLYIFCVAIQRAKLMEMMAFLKHKWCKVKALTCGTSPLQVAENKPPSLLHQAARQVKIVACGVRGRAQSWNSLAPGINVFNEARKSWD